jgi:AmmeMemoRadiSam system protein B
VSEERPRLRAVEAFPVEHEGERMVVLRDPSGYTDAVLMLPMGIVGVVALFDGTRSLVDVQAEIMRAHGELVPRSQLEQMVETLDEHGFMDSARFAERRAAIDAEFLHGPVRAAAHAGGAYAADPARLRADMDAFFTAPAGPGPAAGPRAGAAPVRAVIAPHIDFHRGGPAYAWAYRDLVERADADTFVILGTCHAGMADPFALTRKDYDTPFGPARVDRDLVDTLAKRAGQDCFGSELAHRSEHSIEFQAVFLQYLYASRRDIRIVPVLTSFAHEAIPRARRPADDPRVVAFLGALAEAVAASGRKIAIIAGADLAHVGPRFGDPEPVSTDERARIEREDRAMLAAVEAGDAEGFFGSVAADGDRRRICGLSPIYALLSTIDGARGRLRHYGQSDDPHGVVSYASVVFE